MFVLNNLRCDPKTRWNLRMVTSIAAGILIQIVFGSAYTFGNLNPYMTSYLRYKGISPSLTYTECSWLFAAYFVGQCTFLPLGGSLERMIGLRWALLFGCTISCLGTTLTYFSIQHSFGAVLVTQGFMFGIGAGFSIMLPMACAIRWIRDRPGLATGLVNGGIGGGALIFNSVQTLFVNPENKEVQLEIDGEIYFDQPDVMERVPNLFLLLGGVYALIQFIGCLLMTYPPALNKDEVKIIITTKEGIGSTTTRSMTDDDTMPLLGQKKERKENEGNNDVTIIVDSGVDVNVIDDADGDDKDEEGTFTPKQALKALDFYILLFTFVFNGLGISFISALYKAFGLLFINDDIFLSMVGSTSSAFNYLGRLLWGTFADKFSYKIASMTMSTMFAVLMLTLQITQYTKSKYLFMIYICLLVFSGSGCYTILPAATSKRFGNKYVTTIYGLVATSQIVTVPMTFVIAEMLVSAIGWSWLLFVIGVVSYLGVIVSACFNGKDRYGNDV